MPVSAAGVKNKFQEPERGLFFLGEQANQENQLLAPGEPVAGVSGDLVIDNLRSR